MSMPKAVRHHLIRLNSNCLLANSIKPSSAWSLSIFHLTRKITQPFQFHNKKNHTTFSISLCDDISCRCLCKGSWLVHDRAVVSKTLCYLYFWGSQNLWFLLWIIFKWPFPIWNNCDITGKYACEGKVENKFDMKPHSENLAEYGKLCRERTTKCMAKPRRVEVTDQMMNPPTANTCAPVSIKLPFLPSLLVGTCRWPWKSHETHAWHGWPDAFFRYKCKG